MPRTEKKMSWNREEIQEILERKYNKEFRNLRYCQGAQFLQAEVE